MQVFYEHLRLLLLQVSRDVPLRELDKLEGVVLERSRRLLDDLQRPGGLCLSKGLSSLAASILIRDGGLAPEAWRTWYLVA